MRHQRRKLSSAIVAAVSSTVLLAAAAPAPAESTGPQEEVAQAIEAATGTGDIALSVAAGGKASVAVTETGQGATRVVVPSASSEAVEITAPGGKTLRLGLPDEQSVTGVKSPSGTVVYTGAGRSTDVAVQPTADGGARALVVLKDGSAPQEHRFELGLPEGFGLRAAEDGGYDIGFVSEGVEAMVGHIDPAWAKDANGRAVDTSYRVDGGTLVQSVEYEDSTAFPVVADPKVTWGWGSTSSTTVLRPSAWPRACRSRSTLRRSAASCPVLSGAAVRWLCTTRWAASPTHSRMPASPASA